MDLEDVKKLTVEKLKPELKSRGLDISGKKADLVERLEAYLKSNTTEAKEPAQPAPATDAGVQQNTQPAATQGKQSIVWNPDAATSGSVPSEKPEASTAATDTDAKSLEELEAEKRKARAAKFGTSGVQEGGKRKMESEASGQINASDLVSEDQQAKRRERFLTPEQKEAETAKEEEAKRKQKRHSRFNLDDGKKADRTQRFQQWLAPGSTAAAPAAAAAANGKSAGDKITAAVNSSLDQSAKLLGKGPKGRSGSGKAAAAAPAEPKYTDEFKAKADARKARFAAKA